MSPLRVQMGLPACMFASPAEPNSRPTTTAFTPIQRPTCRTTKPPCRSASEQVKALAHLRALRSRNQTMAACPGPSKTASRCRGHGTHVGRAATEACKARQSAAAHHCPSSLRASGALFGAVSWHCARERTRMLVTGGDDELGQPASRRPLICASPRCCASNHRPWEWPS